MPKINQGTQPNSGGGNYAETPEQIAGWKRLRSYIRILGLSKGDTFTVKGSIGKIKLDGTEDNPRYFTSKQTNDKGEEKDWPFVKVYAAITDPQFGTPGLLDFPPKNVGASFFDGKTSKGQSPNRGGMYNVHKAVTGSEPSEALVKGSGDWDTEDYENRPILLRLVYDGKEEEGSAYFNRRASMRIFIAGFEKDLDVHRVFAEYDDDDDDPPFVPVTPAPNPAKVEATQNADLSALPASERQVAFVYAIGREVGLSAPELRGWCEATYGAEPELLTRKEASAAIDALQRKRNEEAAPPLRDTGTDELVSVGVKPAPAKPGGEDPDLSF